MPRERRSQGCRRCVDRRIKCDRERPYCRRCQIANLSCDGPPPPDPQFQDETDLTVSRCSGKVASTTRSGDNTSMPASISFDLPILLYEPASYSEDVYCRFFLNSYFNACTLNAEVDFHANKEWILDSFQSPSQHPVSNLALRCLITGYYGCTHRDKTLQHAASDLYTNTLSLLRKQLRNPDQNSEFDVLAAACLLTIYEYTAFTSEIGWLQHLRGIANLFQMKGPSYFHKHPARALFIFMRMNIIFASIIWREKTFLEQPEWQDFLISEHTDEVTLQAIRITNLLARLPGLIQDADHQATNQQSQKLENPNRPWLNLLDDLADWYRKWTNTLPLHLPHAVPSSITEAKYTSPLYWKNIWYTRLDVAAAFCQYHAIVILVHRWLQPQSLTPSSSQDQINSHLTTANHHAMAICKSIPYFLAGDHANSGAFHLLFPAYVACQSTTVTQPERYWLLGILNSVAGDKGIAIASNLVDKINQRGVSGS